MDEVGEAKSSEQDGYLMTGDKVRFGSELVLPEDKRVRVRALFDSVSGRYDLMNDLMSAGLHRLWKARAITMLRPEPGDLLIDVAGGTGDMAAAFLRRAGVLGTAGESSARAVVCDFSQAMLERGNSGYRVCGDAMRLPLGDSVADAVCIAFGLRNVADIPVALGECARVLRPGGRFVCLELGQPQAFSVRRVYDSASAMLPVLGCWITGDRGAYQYLVDSIRSFPDRRTIVSLMRSAGLTGVRYHDMAFGIVTAFQAGKPVG